MQREKGFIQMEGYWMKLPGVAVQSRPTLAEGEKKPA